MLDKQLEAAAAEKKMLFDYMWNAAVTFEAAFSTSDKEDWYNEARIVRGGYAMSQLSSDLLEEYVAFMLNNVRMRGSSKRREMKTNAVQEMFSQQRKVISGEVETWLARSRELEVTLPVERQNSKVAHYADAEIRDLVLHLGAGKLNREDFDSKVKEVMERFKMTPAALSEWKTSQDIHF